MKKVLLYTMVTLALLLNVVSVNANENTVNNSFDESSGSIEPRWWPGNPNPEPGSEAWLQSYGGYKPSSSGKARECAIKALVGSGLTGGVELWLAKGALSVLSFAKSFGVGWAVSYCGCITGLW